MHSPLLTILCTERDLKAAGCLYTAVDKHNNIDNTIPN